VFHVRSFLRTFLGFFAVRGCISLAEHLQTSFFSESSNTFSLCVSEQNGSDRGLCVLLARDIGCVELAELGLHECQASEAVFGVAAQEGAKVGAGYRVVQTLPSQRSLLVRGTPACER
jgi:hypothetical protein